MRPITTVYKHRDLTKKDDSLSKRGQEKECSHAIQMEFVK